LPTPIEDFLVAIDERWDGAPGPRIRLRMIGSTALMLQVDYVRGTKDGDVLETADLAPEVKARLLAIADKGTQLATAHRMYLDIVGNGLPFLPLAPVWNPVPGLNARLTHFQVDALAVLDTLVSKLKRFNANDQADIEAMVEMDLVDPQGLVDRFRSAVDRFSGDARAENLPTYVRHLHRVEREMLVVKESEIDLPSWI